MMIYIALLVFWMVAMMLATYLFCGAARTFLDASEKERISVRAVVRHSSLRHGG